MKFQKTTLKCFVFCTKQLTVDYNKTN